VDLPFFILKIQRGRPHCKSFLLILKKGKKDVQTEAKKLNNMASKRAGETALNRSKRN
jgi:hypothetical protein